MVRTSMASPFATRIVAYVAISAWSCACNKTGVSATQGVCGPANGQTLSSAPTANLCSLGTSSTVTGAGPWLWTCNGANGGSNDRCSASLSTTAGVCGTANGQTLSTAPTSDLCNAGTATVVSGTGPWTWSCDGGDGGSDASCSAGVVPTNGACGSANGQVTSATPATNLCSAGLPSGVAGSGPWSWTCDGTDGGMNASCIGYAASQVIPSTLFGASFRLQNDPWPPLDGNSQDAKIYATRIWDDWVTDAPAQTGGLKWSDIQPTNATPTWTNLDIRVNQARNMSPTGTPLPIIYTFGGTPEWATVCAGLADPSTCLPGHPDGGYGGGTQCKGPTDYGCLPPSDINADGTGADSYFSTLVSQLAGRYAGEITYYEIWNEADSTNFFCQTGGTVPCGGGSSYTTANTPALQRLVRMAWDLKNIVHCIDPSAAILSPSFHVLTALTWFHNYNITTIDAPAGVAGVNGVPAGCNWPAQTVIGKETYDYVNIHARGDSTVAPSPTGNWNPDAITVAYANTAQEIANDDLPNPTVIFNDEYGYTTATEGGGNVSSYSAYVSRGLIWCASLGFTQCDWYQWDSQFGAGLSETANGTAYDTTVGWLTGAIITAPCTDAGTLYTCGVLQGGTNYLIAWDTSKTCNPSCTYDSHSFGAQYGHYDDLTSSANATSGGNGTAPVGWQPIRLGP
jgi:hypothetical protein